jgi:DNA-binding MarR family transcriptional regulator
MNTNETLQGLNNRCACFNLRKATRAVTQYYDRNLEPAGIRATQFTLLVTLACSTARTLTEMAEGLVMDRTTLTRNLKPIELSGLIHLVQTLDKRTKAYALTELGRKVLAQSIPLWEIAQGRVIQEFGQLKYNNLLLELEELQKKINGLEAEKEEEESNY